MRRHAFAMLALVPALAFGLAACGSDGGGKNSTDKKAAQQASDDEKMRKFAACMRANGVQMDDPQPGGGPVRIGSKKVGKGGAGSKGLSTDDNKMKTAMDKCRSLMPNGGKPQKLSAADMAKMREFAKCMRGKGVDMPDPSDDGMVTMRNKKGSKIDEKDMEKAQKDCEKFMPKRIGPGGKS